MKTLMKMLLTLLVIAVLLLGLAQAEETPGHVPSRGLTLPVTQADMDLGLNMMTDMTRTVDGQDVPVFFLTYMAPGYADALNAAMEAYATGDDAAIQAAMDHYYQQVYITDVIYLFKAGYDYTALPGLADQTTRLGENDGFVYLHETRTPAANAPEHQQSLEAAIARSRELVAAVTFQPIVFEPGEMSQVPNAFPTFTTQDLHGNTVTDEIFRGKTLTVVNIWGTYCTPCINEMPYLGELAEEYDSSKVQIVGIPTDVYNQEYLDYALSLINETDADYTHLLMSEELYNWGLTEIQYVPTTFFVNSEGEIIDTVVGSMSKEDWKVLIDEKLASL